MKTSKNLFASLHCICTLLIIGILFANFSYAFSQSKAKSVLSDDFLSINNLIKLTAIGNGYSDQAIIVFVPDATAGFDPEYDAYKLMGIYEAPQLYSFIPCCILTVNALPEITTNLKVQLGFQVGIETSYTLSATELYSFDPGVTIHLLDSKDNVLTDFMVDSTYTFTASPDDCYERFSLFFNLTSNFLDLNVFLEGPFNSAGMNTELTSKNLIPLNQPYNVAPWNYAGAESVTSMPDNVVDWILLEFRDAVDAATATSATTFGWQAALLFSNGKVKGLDGCNTIDFSGSITNNLFVVVHHRNHLAVMSANALVKAGGVYSYDFSSGVSQAYNGSLAHKDLGAGVYGMLGGDANSDGVINDSDATAVWYSEAGENGYLASDVTLDGESNNVDKDDVWYVNVNSYSQVP
ncbi:MAG: hypothetical protein R2764_10985 [Bacteroidales bacterium]